MRLAAVMLAALSPLAAPAQAPLPEAALRQCLLASTGTANRAYVDEVCSDLALDVCRVGREGEEIASCRAGIACLFMSEGEELRLGRPLPELMPWAARAADCDGAEDGTDCRQALAAAHWQEARAAARAMGMAPNDHGEGVDRCYLD